MNKENPDSQIPIESQEASNVSASNQQGNQSSVVENKKDDIVILKDNSDPESHGENPVSKKDEQKQYLGIKSDLWYIFIWEMIGTFIFAWGINASKGNDFFISASLFGAILLTAGFTGGHLNPAVSTAFYCLTCKSLAKLTITTEQYITYMTAQFTGAFMGGFVAWGILKDINSPYPADETAFWVLRDIMGEIFGTFTFVLIILIVVNKRTNIARHDILVILTICAGLTFSRSFTYHSGGVLNPGIALGLQFFRSLSSFDFTPMVHAYIYIFGPIIGAILSAIFYSKVYIPFLPPREKKPEVSK